MEYIQLSRIFKIVDCCFLFPTPFTLFATFFFSWRFCLHAVIVLKFHKLALAYVVLFQLLLHALHWRFLRLSASVQHINNHCNKIIGRYQIWTLWYTIHWTETNKNLLCFHHCQIPSQLTPPPSVHIPISPFSLTYSYIWYEYRMGLGLSGTQIVGLVIEILMFFLLVCLL
jgi:hypothetical protein